MKKELASKKLQLTKIKVANLSAPKGKVCITSADQTTCPSCKLTLSITC